MYTLNDLYAHPREFEVNEGVSQIIGKKRHTPVRNAPPFIVVECETSAQVSDLYSAISAQAPFGMTDTYAEGLAERASAERARDRLYKDKPLFRFGMYMVHYQDPDVMKIDFINLRDWRGSESIQIIQFSQLDLKARVDSTERDLVIGAHAFQTLFG